MQLNVSLLWCLLLLVLSACEAGDTTGTQGPTTEGVEATTNGVTAEDRLDRGLGIE